MTTYYVATTGNDGNVGSLGSPWLTMTKAVSTAVAGDTVRFLSGTYSSAGSITQTNNGTAGNPITFVSDTYHGATLSSTDVAQVLPFLDFQGDYIVVDGFNITAPGNYIAVLMHGQFPLARRLNIFHVCDFQTTSSGGAGIDFAHLSGFTQVINGVCDSCKVVNIGGGYGSTYTFRTSIQGIYVSNPFGSVTNCLVADIAGYGIHAYHNGSNWTVENNTVIRGGNGGILIGTGPSGFNQVGSAVRNNIVKNCALYGIREFEDTGQVTVGLVIYDHNNVTGSGTAAYFLYPAINNLTGVANVATNDTPGDPLFANYQDDGSGDYHLTSGSPCIDTGTAVGIPARDYDGNGRSASHPAIGAYTFVNYASFSSFMTHV